MNSDSIFVTNQESLNYRFNDHHPFNQNRLILTYDLLKKVGAFSNIREIKPIQAAEEDILRIHEKRYVEAVKALSVMKPDPQVTAEAQAFGLGTNDTPYFPNMHEVTSHIAGGSIEAVKQVMSGQAKHALHLAGGLHHAFPDRGGGFCVYNDASIAIAYIREHYDAKVMYIDTDVHHGDGVQWSFYDDPNVFTFSIHETGKYLFPGTGFVEERGTNEGFGYNLNMPVEPYTEDESWLECFNELVEKAVRRFKPDLIVSQHGCDAHVLDPLAHTHCTMQIYRDMPKVIHRLAHEHSEGRWVALGGGGYEIWRVVPRAWSMLWLEMIDHPLLQELERNPALTLPQSWLDKWRKLSPVPLPETWLDVHENWDPIPRRKEINEKNRHTCEIAGLYL